MVGFGFGFGLIPCDKPAPCYAMDSDVTLSAMDLFKIYALIRQRSKGDGYRPRSSNGRIGKKPTAPRGPDKSSYYQMLDGTLIPSKASPHTKKPDTMISTMPIVIERELP